jgi:hypothetical protein
MTILGTIICFLAGYGLTVQITLEGILWLAFGAFLISPGTYLQAIVKLNEQRGKRHSK